MYLLTSFVCIMLANNSQTEYICRRIILIDMGQTAVTIRMDSDLKNQFDGLCNEFGMSVNTAFNIFVRTVVRTRSIPFAIESNRPSNDELLEKGRNIFELLRKQAKEEGLETLTLDEINEEINKVRNNKCM